MLAAVTRSPGEMVIEDVSGPGRARGRLTAGEQVVVFGAGPIGLAMLIAAVSQGANVLSVDPQATRRDLARRLGAEQATVP